MRRGKRKETSEFLTVEHTQLPNMVTFFDQKLPRSFVINYKGENIPKNRQKVGYCSVTNQNLFWENGSVVARSGK